MTALKPRRPTIGAVENLMCLFAEDLLKDHPGAVSVTLQAERLDLHVVVTACRRGPAFTPMPDGPRATED